MARYILIFRQRTPIVDKLQMAEAAYVGISTQVVELIRADAASEEECLDMLADEVDSDSGGGTEMSWYRL